MLGDYLRKDIVGITSLDAWLIAVSFGVRALVLYADTQVVRRCRRNIGPASQGSSFHRKNRRCFFSRVHNAPVPIGELALIMARCRRQVAATVFFYVPAAHAKEWATNDLWQSALGISGVRVVADIDARTARRFGARTSGQVFLCNAPVPLPLAAESPPRVGMRATTMDETQSSP